MMQSTRNIATAIYCLVALVPVVAANPTARSPISGTRTAVHLLASVAHRTVKAARPFRIDTGQSNQLCPGNSSADFLVYSPVAISAFVQKAGPPDA